MPRSCIMLLGLAWILAAATCAGGEDDRRQRVAAVTAMPGLVAFWDFVAREPDGERRFVAHVPPGAATDYPLDAGNYVRDYWGEGRQATLADFPVAANGPFGGAIRIRKEEDPAFRPFLFVPRSRLHDTPLDIKGQGRSVTVVVWAVRESGNHALAGIWHEGTDLQQESTRGIRRVERGQRQYALFAGLNKEGSACGHVSENGAGSFLNRYALHKCNSVGLAAAVPADAAPERLAAGWHCFAMTFDHRRHEITGWLDGTAGDRWLEAPQQDKLLSFAANAWLQGRLRRQEGMQEGEDPAFPAAQCYDPPEEEPVAVEVVRETAEERVEDREYPFTRVRVRLRRSPAGAWTETARDLTALRLNPWWYPHGIHAPADADSGGPFTIGRVIHSARSVGFTGWIGGVAVFDRALSAAELANLARLTRTAPGDEPAVERPPVRLGIIGLDTSHATAFARLFNVVEDPQHVPGCRVVAAHPHGSRTIESSRSRIPDISRAVRETGVEIVDGIGPLLDRVDAVLLETNDGGPHLEQAAIVIRAGKPLFIDKPVAATLADVVAIYRLAEDAHVPVFSSSALRFAAATQAVRDGSLGEVTGCDTWSPCSLEPSHADLFWYGIHGCESLFTVMGPGCESVTRTGTADFDHVAGVWADGRIGTFRGIRRGAAGYGGTAFGTRGTAAVGGFDGYRPLAMAIAAFVRTGRPPVPASETIALYAFMEAADESRRRGGGPVRVADVLARAEAAATGRLAELARGAAAPPADAAVTPAAEPRP